MNYSLEKLFNLDYGKISFVILLILLVYFFIYTRYHEKFGPGTTNISKTNISKIEDNLIVGNLKVKGSITLIDTETPPDKNPHNITIKNLNNGLLNFKDGNSTSYIDLSLSDGRETGIYAQNMWKGGEYNLIVKR